MLPGQDIALLSVFFCGYDDEPVEGRSIEPEQIASSSLVNLDMCVVSVANGGWPFDDPGIGHHHWTEVLD